LGLEALDITSNLVGWSLRHAWGFRKYATHKQTCISKINSLRDLRRQKDLKFNSRKGRRITKDPLISKPFVAKVYL